MGRPILERERELTVLAAAARSAAAGAGSVALVSGEAGIGKSSLVEAVPAHLPAGCRLLVGYCDDFATKRTLGPFRDLAGSVGSELSRAVQSNDRDRVLAALRTELDWAGHPTLLAVEDVHWADDATLDALRYLVRRVADLPAVLLLTYRDDELTSDHPVRQLLGVASSVPRLHRLPLRRLSEDAVRKLSADRPVDAGHVYAVTSGNPFFVSEVLASGAGERVPPTVVDAVVARVRRLAVAHQEALEQLAVVPSALDRWLAEALVPGGLATLAVAEQRGLLAVSPSRITFRHELTRRAIADALPVARRLELNRRVLTALTQRDGADLSQLVHHAAQAGDLEAIARYGPAAAGDAARAGAHREAVAHYRLVLQQRDRFSPIECAELLERYAVECYTIGESQDAVDAQRDAVELRRSLGDRRRYGAALRWLSRMHWWNGDRTRAEQVAGEATAVLEDAGDQRLLALALSNQSQLHMLAHRAGESIELGERAATLARAVGDPAILSHALTNIGAARWNDNDPRAKLALDEALQVALSAGETEHALRAYIAIASALLDRAHLVEAERYLDEGIALAEGAEHLGFLGFLSLERARLTLARGAWDDAQREVQFAVDAQPPMRWGALLVLGRIGVRRGDPGAAEVLTQAWDISVGIREPQRTAPIAAVRAEAAWLRGDHAAVRAIAGPVYDEVRQLGAMEYAAELGYWLAKAGQPVAAIEADHPYAWQAAGRWRDAAVAWQEAGCPYEYAAALADGDDPEDLLAALAQLDALGAEPLARIVRGRLRRLGVPRVPRGPLDATRQNPAGLTARQLQVLRLLGAGLTNAEIADRLVVSVRTVDSHVAAVLDKLGARTRRQAAARAAELGVGTAKRR